MSTALAQEHAFRGMSKEELVERAVSLSRRAKHLAEKHKPMMKRVGMTIAQTGIATLAGVTAGALQVKLQKIPRTQVRTDLVLGGAIALLNLANVFEEGTPLAQSASDALTGHGMGRVSEKFLLARGVKPST